MNIYTDLHQIIQLGHIPINSLLKSDCLDAMPFIESQSVDLILADLPFGTTNCHWD